MTTYKGLHGTAVQNISGNTGVTQGQIWYDTAASAFKLEAFQVAAWSTGAVRPENISGSTSGTKTAGLVAFGYAYPPVSTPEGGTTKSQEYDGTTWSNANNANTARYQTNSTGLQTTTLSMGGAQGSGTGPFTLSTAVESYDGTNWTTQNSMPGGKASGVPTVGDSSLALVAGGGDTTSGEPSDSVFEYDGTNWTTVTAYPTATNSIGAVGTQTAAFFYGGATNAPGSTKTSNTFTYNGTSFAADQALPTGATGMGGRSGTSSLALMAHGNTPASPSPFNTQTLDWDGTSFSVNPANTNTSSPSAQANQSGSGTGDVLLAARGPAGTNLRITEEWSAQGPVTKTITTS